MISFVILLFTIICSVDNKLDHKDQLIALMIKASSVHSLLSLLAVDSVDDQS